MATLCVGDFCELRIYSGHPLRAEIHDCVIAEIPGAAVARVQLLNGNFLRVCVSQLRKLGEGYKIHSFKGSRNFIKA